LKRDFGEGEDQGRLKLKAAASEAASSSSKLDGRSWGIAFLFEGWELVRAKEGGGDDETSDRHSTSLAPLRKSTLEPKNVFP
jgi:hypothetical protein